MVIDDDSMSVGYHHDESDTSISQDSICFCGWQPIYIIHHHRIAAGIAPHLWLHDKLELVLVQADNYFYPPIFPWFSHHFPMIFPWFSHDFPVHPMTSRDIPRLPSFWDREIPTFSADTWSESLGLPVHPFHPFHESSRNGVMGWLGWLGGIPRPGKA